MRNQIRCARGFRSSPVRPVVFACLLSAVACLVGAVFFAPTVASLGANAASGPPPNDPMPDQLLLTLLEGQAPEDYETIRQALEFYRTGKCPEAEPLLQKILLHQPKNIAVRKLLANCLLKEKKTDEAKAQFQLVLQAAPRDVDALQGLQGAVTEIQKREELKQTLAIQTRTATEEQLRASHEFQRAAELIKSQRLREAEKILSEIVSKQPNSVPPRQRLAEIYSTTQRYEQAAEMYRSLTEMPAASSTFLFRSAQNFEWSGDYPQAIRYYRLYLNKKPDDQFARMGLANVLMWSGRYQEAVPEWERLRSARPKDMRVPLALAQCYEQLSEQDKALQAYQRILELDPTNPLARAALRRHEQYLDQLPRTKAFAALEHNDYGSAAKYFAEYLQKHPDSTETLLQIARVYSWGQRFPEAARYYQEFLRRAPQDYKVRRELAQLDMWMKDYAAARNEYQLLIQSPVASIDDYETLIHAYDWGGDLAGAEPYAKKLAGLQPSNAVAQQALNQLFEQRRLAARTKAEELAAVGRFTEAVEAYRSYMDSYGRNRQLELLIPRLYSWGKDYRHAGQAYRDYLRRYPNDLQARLELANMETWAGHYDQAETEYQAVLQQNPREVAALVGLAQVRDYRGEDPFKVRDSYLEVLGVEPRNPIAEGRLEEIRALVKPALSYLENSFRDSDGLIWSTNTIQASFPLPGRIKITPFYTFGYFHQRASNGSLTILGNGGGGRFEISRSGWSALGELGAIQFGNAHFGDNKFNVGRSSLNGRAELTVRAGTKGLAGLAYSHRDAIYDLNAFAPLLVGIMGDTVFLSYQRPLSERSRIWVAGGGSHYTAGAVPGRPDNWQPRLSVRVDYQPKPWLTFGYSGRLTGFQSRSTFYFSPWHYQTHGVGYSLARVISKTVRVTADGELDYGRITTNPGALGNTVNTIELSVVPRLNWQVRRNLTLRLGYRFSRGAGSVFNRSLIYRTHGIEIGLSKQF